MKTLLCLVLGVSLVSSHARAEDLIRVSGSAEKKFAPDVAYVMIEAWSKAKEARSAQELNAKELTAARSTLESRFKVPAKDLKTVHFAVNPEYEYRPNHERVLLGFAANHSLEVTIRDLNLVGTLLDALVKSGPNSGINLSGVRFGSEKLPTLEAQVLADAMANARLRADAIAKATGREIKKVRSVTHGAPAISLPQRDGIMSLGMRGGAKSAPVAETSVQPGEITVGAEVTVDYEF